MGDIPQQLLLDFQQVANPFGHRIEVRGQQSELIASTLELRRDTHVEITSRNATRGMPELIHGGDEIAREEKADGSTDDKGDDQGGCGDARHFELAEQMWSRSE